MHSELVHGAVFNKLFYDEATTRDHSCRVTYSSWSQHGFGLQGHLIGVYMTEGRCELTFLPEEIVIVIYMFGFTAGQTKTVPPRAK